MCPFKIRLCTREQFAARVTNERENGFAKTFVAKADLSGLWPALGTWAGAELAAALAYSVNKRPVAGARVANLQLLHTFPRWRRKGAAALLCREFVRAVADQADYYRVSSEPEATPFYRSQGVVFCGRQKSGCLLAVGRLVGDTLGQCVYDPADPVVLACVHKKGRGGCVEVF